nr:PREDICTED: uncharacterized protein LOC108953178 isoform X2 [Musa acuminata subsp. malaccensis]
MKVIKLQRMALLCTSSALDAAPSSDHINVARWYNNHIDPLFKLCRGISEEDKAAKIKTSATEEASSFAAVIDKLKSVDHRQRRKKDMYPNQQQCL